MLRRITRAAVVLSVGVVANGVQANTLTLFNVAGTALSSGDHRYSVSCVGAGTCIQGFFGTALNSSNQLSGSKATGYGIGSANEKNELAKLNQLLAGLAPTVASVVLGTPNSGAGYRFTTDREYFSIKQSNWTAYFKNTSGGSVTVNFAAGGEKRNYSHFTTYGSVVTPVPLPAAAWLFGSALLGFLGVDSRRRRQSVS